MRPGTTTRLFALILLVAACSLGSEAAGWRGTDVHLVDGTWIGTETECGDGDEHLECRTVVALGLTVLAPDVRSQAVRAVVAALPTTFATTTGETRTARLSSGILSLKAVVVDLGDGTRRVIGLWCHLPYGGNGGGGLMVRDVTCGMDPTALEEWRDGNVPPSIPPGANFG